MDSANHVGGLFGLLLMAHLVGDFWLQPLRLVLWKQREWGGLWVHSGIHSVLILLVAGGDALQWIIPALIFLPFHALVDKAKVEFDLRFPGYSLPSFFLDQVVHFSSVAVAAALGARFGLTMSPPFGSYILERLVVVNSYLGVMIAGTVVVWVVARAYDTETKGISTIEWWSGALERGLLLTALLLSNPWLLPLALVPRLLMGAAYWRRGEFIKFASGVVLTAAVWWIV